MVTRVYSDVAIALTSCTRAASPRMREAAGASSVDGPAGEAAPTPVLSAGSGFAFGLTGRAFASGWLSLPLAPSNSSPRNADLPTLPMLALAVGVAVVS